MQLTSANRSTRLRGTRNLAADHARQGVQRLVRAPDSARCAALAVTRASPLRQACGRPCGPIHLCRRPGWLLRCPAAPWTPNRGPFWSLLRDRSWSGCLPPAVRTGPVLGGPGSGPRYCWWSGPAVRSIQRLGIGAEHVGQCGPHAQDQDRQAGHHRRDGPRRPRHPSLGHQVVGHLPGHAEREGADRGPPGEPACPGADRPIAGQPGAQRVRRVGLDADREGDGRVQVQRWPDSRQRGDQPEPGLLRDADPAGPDLECGRGGQDQLPCEDLEGGAGFNGLLN